MWPGDAERLPAFGHVAYLPVWLPGASRNIRLRCFIDLLLEQQPTASDKFFICSHRMITPNGFGEVFH